MQIGLRHNSFSHQLDLLPTLMSKRSSFTLRTVPLRDALPCSFTATLTFADTAETFARTDTAAARLVLAARTGPA
jgi:hypothetical protein